MMILPMLKLSSDWVDLSTSLASLALHPRIVLVQMEAARLSKTSSRPTQTQLPGQLADSNQTQLKPGPKAVDFLAYVANRSSP